MKYGIFIISHGRPWCTTPSALLKAGYTGEWFIVADNLDDTQYEDLYPNHVIRFDKPAYMAKVDTVDNFGIVKSSLYARHACFDLARERHYDCFGLFDDDISGFSYRYTDCGVLRCACIRDIDTVFEAYCEFAMCSDAACVAFINENTLIGGISNRAVVDGYTYEPFNTYIINTHRPQIPFTGSMEEDVSYVYMNNNVGNLCIAIMPVVYRMASMPWYVDDSGDLASGGCHDVYSHYGEYVCRAYGLITFPGNFDFVSRSGKFKYYRNNLVRILSPEMRKQTDITPTKNNNAQICTDGDVK